jgi:hypothetical protein
LEARKLVVAEFDRRATRDDLSNVFKYYGSAEVWKNQVGTCAWGGMPEMQLGLAASPILVVVLDASVGLTEPSANLTEIIEYSLSLHRNPASAKMVVFAIWHDQHFSLARFRKTDGTWIVHVPIGAWEVFGRTLLAALRGGLQFEEWKFATKQGNVL